MKWKLIQVCYDVNDIGTFSREKKAIFIGLQKLGLNNGTILSNYEKRVEQIGKYTLNIIPAWEWLLKSEI